jgi:hypothetical protein
MEAAKMRSMRAVRCVNLVPMRKIGSGTKGIGNESMTTVTGTMSVMIARGNRRNATATMIVMVTIRSTIVVGMGIVHTRRAGLL